MSSDRQSGGFDAEREAGYEAVLKAIVLKVLEGLPCEAFLFGSRPRGEARRSSDFDIGIRGLSPEAFSRARRIIEEEVEEGPIPHEVDVVDFDRASEPFKSAALAGGIVWKSA